MIAEHQIRQQLAKYLHDEMSLDHFEDWFVQRSWNMHRDSMDAAQKLASAIELRLAEHSSGHLSENDLREELLPFVTTYNAVVSFGQPAAAVPSSDAHYTSPSPRVFVVLQEGDLFQALADTQRAAVSV
ncbi:MAG TPA: hypothetical protein VFO39_07570 [Candidatus Sulfotelmatobacter sp.]|nr:hypothetical protein [Candidatus Sulfotelmatobacter sp.]